MSRGVTRAIALVCLLMAPTVARGQLLEAKEAGVVYGHHHLNVSDVDAHVRFLAGTLGGVPITVAGQRVVKFPNVLVFLRRQPPTGGSKGSAVDHVGFAVPNLRAVVERVRANGFRVVTQEEASSAWQVKDGIGTQGDRAIAFVMGPDGLKVELVQVKTLTSPSALHHVHFASPQSADMQTWYGTVFRAKTGPAGTPATSLLLPGGQLSFMRAPGEVAPTAGRVIDHIGFEIDYLEGFLVRLEDMGVKVAGVQKSRDVGVAASFIADPWGTSIELTQGLDEIK